MPNHAPGDPPSLEESLFIAIADNNDIGLRDALKRGANPNAMDSLGFNPLMRAIDHQAWECAEVLAPVTELSARGSQGRLALHFAASFNRPHLLEAVGASDPELCAARDRRGDTPLMIAARRGNLFLSQRYNDTQTANLLRAASRHFFLINASDAKRAHDGALDFISSPHGSKRLLDHDSRASSLLGLVSCALSTERYVELTRVFRYGQAAPGQEIPGLDLIGAGSYIVELVLGEFNPGYNYNGPSSHRHIIGVNPTEPTMDVDAWEKNNSFSEAFLREEISALIERHDLARSIPESPARRIASL